MELSPNPFAILTFISAPAVLTNASCVLLFGTGNRYGRAVDRVHELVDAVQRTTELSEAERGLRIRQLEAGEIRVSLIVRALTCFYTAVAGFVASTLISLMGGILVSLRSGPAVVASFAVGMATGCVGVFAMIAGALLLARETRYSFRVLREERAYVTNMVESLRQKYE